MTSPVRHRALSLAAGTLPTVAIWWFVRDPALAVAVGVSLLVSALLWFRVSRRYGERFADETWQDRKWISLGTGLLVFVSFNGTLLLPVSLEYRVGIQALVLGGALVGYAVGTLTEIERDLSRENSGDRPGGDAVGADD
jgi:peptidoglycan biosynthesis protein MviN/MurJ (putative lipid II flippase)